MTGIFHLKKTVYTFSTYRSEDRDAVIRMFVEHSLECGRIVTESEMSALLKRPGADLENNLFIAKSKGETIAYLRLTPEPLVNRMNLGGWTSPDHRRQGIATGLLKLAIDRTRETGLKMIVTGVSQENRIARTLLPHLGFTYVHRFLELELRIDTVPFQSLYRAGLGCRTMLPGDEREVMELQNKAFEGHWGFPHYTMDTFMFDIGLNHRTPQDIILYSEGTRIVGYCWTEIFEFTDVNGTKKRGIIDMIGIDPASRGRGLGEKLLLAGIDHLKDKGVKKVTLTVDSENKPARELYRKIGFTEYGSTLWYGLDTDYGTDR